jgi:hypothetical protein
MPPRTTRIGLYVAEDYSRPDEGKNMHLKRLKPTSLSNLPLSLKVDVLQCQWLTIPVITPHSTFT